MIVWDVVKRRFIKRRSSSMRAPDTHGARILKIRVCALMHSDIESSKAPDYKRECRMAMKDEHGIQPSDVPSGRVDVGFTG